jgi:hydroxymethylpyrimidine/phosphomethylpyrimidine kinase
MEKKYNYISVLTIAGFDGSGGAGIQGDIKTISALGCFATSVLTALPVQNTRGVSAIPVNIVKLQIDAILEDIFPDVVKIGMIHTPELAAIIGDTLLQHPSLQIVLDPVMVSSSGRKLMEDATIHSMIDKLFPMADLITPNMDEAAILSGMPVTCLAEMKIAGLKIMELGCKALLLKGGHLNENTLTSLYFSADGQMIPIISKKVESTNTHGTGCTLSSAIASYLALGKPMIEAITMANEYVQQAIIQSADVQIGKGKGPLNHFFNPQQMVKIEMDRHLNEL